MAKKFKETIKTLKNADMLYIRKLPDGRVEMLDGHFIVRVTEFDYMTEFQPSSSRFRTLDDGKAYEARNDRKAIPTETDHVYDTGKMFEIANDADFAEDTGIVLEFAGLVASVKIYKALNGNLVFLDTKFASMLDEFRDGGTQIYMTNEKSPVYITAGNGNPEAMFLPVGVQKGIWTEKFEAITKYLKEDA